VLAIRQRRISGRGAQAQSGGSISCATCGAQLRAGAQFCSQCGRPVDTAARRICARCDQSLRPGAAYCGHCGAAA